MRFDLSDDEWALLEPLMPKSRKSARADDRKIMNAIFYVLRTGMPWRDLPERYGPYTTAYNRFNPLVSARHPETNFWIAPRVPIVLGCRNTRVCTQIAH